MTVHRPYYDGLPPRHHVAEPVEPATSLSLLLAGSGNLLISASDWVTWRIKRVRRRWSLRGLFNLHNGLILVWALVLWWGEWAVFRQSTEVCDWKNWESWPVGATPHHLAFVADPQLVDPHTYPGRPWPLSTLTILHTDLYLRRSFSLIQQTLHPDTVFFLGDLFDGGREWATYNSESPEKQYKRYGEGFWLREYGRFSRIFFDHWGDGGMSPNEGQRGRKIIASLPGNHDLGLGVGIQLAVRERFNAYFGEGNRVDVIGNHTFVSVDVVSLSAKDQPGTEAVSPEDRGKLWRPVDEFLDGVQAAKRRAVAAEIRHQNGGAEGIRHEHIVTHADDPGVSVMPPTLDPGGGSPEFPTILLTHVPLYRPEGTPCGPLREHWPPSLPPRGQTGPLEHDERNAIAVRRGYQYQNVLMPETSKDLVEKVGNVGYVFSGDDHDYCEVLHKRYTGSPLTGAILEITVKSISWAMGVRKPGFLLLSLWNPVDGHGNPVSTREGGGEPGQKTVQTHLCLLPDQLAIFIRYALLIGVTISALLIRAFLVTFDILEPFTEPAIPPYIDGPLLPTTTTSPPPRSKLSLFSSAEHEKSTEARGRPNPYGTHSQTSSESSTASTASSNSSGLSVRNPASRTTTRGGSPSCGGYGIPPTPPSFSPRLGESRSKAEVGRRHGSRGGVGKGKLLRREVFWGLWRVTWVVLVWYGWLAWRG
ncbi:hypothetical protein FGG08_006807 [Glutinoglossum americanum]|uniref:Calcineurin-like phosphoesterase domain-containing protein n=1 Tax=Glutinoglossum americanum TaxID=1670608 RepID=A0A9P8I6L6_9PEZI|nr:hypothetical protein FGG08_006807 [Glutinoglossum americanum]